MLSKELGEEVAGLEPRPCRTRGFTEGLGLRRTEGDVDAFDGLACGISEPDRA